MTSRTAIATTTIIIIMACASCLKELKDTNVEPIALKSRELAVKNEIKHISEAELRKLLKSKRKDLRPLLRDRILSRGRNLIYSDKKTGTEFWVHYDGKDAIEYGASERGGQDIPVRIIEGKAERLIIWHFCTSTTVGEGIGDCLVTFCDPIFKVPL